MPELQAQAAVELATAEDYKATFESFRPGTKVLEDLTARFHDRPVYVAGGIEAQRETERRAAQKQVLEWIFSRLAQPEQERKANDSA